MKPQLIDLDYTFTEPFMVKDISEPYFKNTHHFHNDYELVFVLESSGKRFIGDHIGNFKTGDMVFFGPGLPHAWFNDQEYYKENGNLIARSIVTYFKASWLQQEVKALPFSEKFERTLLNAKRGIRVEGAARNRISIILKQFPQSFGLKKTIDILTILHELAENEEYELLAGISYVNQANANEAQRINQVYEYVMKNFLHPIKLDDVADIANMSPNAFCRYFKSQTQKNFSHFVNEIRIGHARKLLQKKDLTISQICYESGFQSMTNFNKFFKRYTRKSPLEYRKAVFNL